MGSKMGSKKGGVRMIPPFVEKAHQAISEMRPGRTISAGELIRVLIDKIGKPSKIGYWHWSLADAECSGLLEFTGQWGAKTKFLRINPVYRIRQEPDFWEQMKRRTD